MEEGWLHWNLWQQLYFSILLILVVLLNPRVITTMKVVIYFCISSIHYYILLKIHRGQHLRYFLKLDFDKKMLISAHLFVEKFDEFNMAWLRRGHPVLDIGDSSTEASKSLDLLLDQLRYSTVKSLNNSAMIVLINRCVFLLASVPMKLCLILLSRMGWHITMFTPERNFYTHQDNWHLGWRVWLYYTCRKKCRSIKWSGLANDGHVPPCRKGNLSNNIWLSRT